MHVRSKLGCHPSKEFFPNKWRHAQYCNFGYLLLDTWTNFINVYPYPTKNLDAIPKCNFEGSVNCWETIALLTLVREILWAFWYFNLDPCFLFFNSYGCTMGSSKFSLAFPLAYIDCPLTLNAIDYMDGFEVRMWKWVGSAFGYWEMLYVSVPIINLDSMVPSKFLSKYSILSLLFVMWYVWCQF